MEFNGMGNFIYKDDYNLKTKISFNWEQNKFAKNPKLEISAISNEDSLIYELYNLPFFPWDMTGETSGGIAISGEGLALKSRGEKIDRGIDEISLSFTCNSIKVGNKEGSFGFIEFYFPNIFIGFNDFEKVSKSQLRNTSNLELEYKGTRYNITFSGLNDIVNKKNEIRASGNDILTLKVKVSHNYENISFGEAEDLMEIISELISIVYGDSVNWIHAIGYNEETATYNVLRDVNYSSLNVFRQLIQLKFPFQLTSFIKQTFSVYAGFSQDKREALKRLSSGLQFASERLVFPVPFNSLGSCIEDFVSDIIPETESCYITRVERRKIDSSFADWVSENIIPKLSDLDKGDFNESGMKQKLSALVQRTLRSRISNLLDYYNLDCEQAWVSDFVKKRNDAAHGNYVFEENDYLIWTRMAAMLERILLKELDFKGDYFDWSEIPPASKELR